MKSVAEQKVLESMLKKGSISALSEEAQGDTTNLSGLIKSVKLTFDKNKFSVESATPLSSVKVSMDTGKENGIEIQDEGVAVIDAKEILDWTTRQSEAKIGINLVELDIPESVDANDDDMEKDVKSALLKVGDLRLSSKDKTSTGSKWSMSSYDPKQLPKTFKGSSNTKDVIRVSPKAMLDAVNTIIFSIQQKDYQHVFDSFCLQKHNGKIYLGATDQKRCAVYNVTDLITSEGNYFDDETTKILIPAVTLQNILKVADESEDVALVYDEEKHVLFVEQKNMKARIAIPEKNLYSKFPTLSALTEKAYHGVGEVPRKTLVSRLITISMVNKESALFVLDKGTMYVHAISDSGKAPSTCSCPIDYKDDKEIRSVWCVYHLMDMLKAIKDDSVTFGIPDDNQSVKIQSSSDPNLSFYGMNIDNPKYANVKIKSKS